VAIQGQKQVTYNVTSMVPHQVTRKVAVNTVRHVEEEITVMKAVTVAKTMQVGTRVSYAPIGTGASANGAGGGATALQPTPDTKASARNPDGTPKRTASGEKLDEFSPGLAPEDFNKRNGANPTKISYPTPIEEEPADQGRMTETSVPARQAAPTRPSLSPPSVVRVSQWVARMPLPANSPSTVKAPTMSLAGNVP
jgi:hypothetical protein